MKWFTVISFVFLTLQDHCQIDINIFVATWSPKLNHLFFNIHLFYNMNIKISCEFWTFPIQKYSSHDLIPYSLLYSKVSPNHYLHENILPIKLSHNSLSNTKIIFALYLYCSHLQTEQSLLQYFDWMVERISIGPL